jgi:nitroreductase
MLTVTEALKRRISTREFLSQPVAEGLVRDILEVARWAPSGGNLQPRKVITIAGPERGLRGIRRNSGPRIARGARTKVSSCIQESWATLRSSLKVHFSLHEHELIYCGMALGYADKTAAVNSLRSDRAPVERFACFRGFA